MISAMKLAFIMSIVFSTTIFCHQVGKFCVICIIFICLHLDLSYAHCRMVSASLEMWLPTYLPGLKWA